MKTNKELIKLYPWLKDRNCWDDELISEQDDCSKLDELPIGWRIKFGDKLCKKIDKLLKKANYQNDYRIAQIKEKWRVFKLV